MSTPEPTIQNPWIGFAADNKQEQATDATPQVPDFTTVVSGLTDEQATEMAQVLTNRLNMTAEQRRIAQLEREINALKGGAN